MISLYNRLTQEKIELVAEGKALFVHSQGRDLTAEEQERDDAIQNRLSAVDAEIGELNRAPDGAPVQTFRPNADTGLVADLPADTPRRHVGTGRTYASLFGADKANMRGFASGEEFFGLVHSGQHDPRLIMALASEGMPSDGGFMVPEQLTAEMLDASLEDEIVRPRASVYPMSSATRKIAGFDCSNSSATLYGGFTGQWVAEGATITLEEPEVRLLELVAKKLGILSKTSNELLSDSSYENELQKALTKAIGWFCDYAFLHGTGAGQPLGVLNDPALLTVAKETGQTAATIVYENLTKMLTRLHPACVNNAIWVANASTRAELLELTIMVGAGGSYIPVLSESAGQFRMLTIPVVFTEKIPALGAKGDILLADFSQYAIGLRGGMSLARSEHVGFASDTSYFRALLRADGMGKWGSAYSPKLGADLSWCVTLDERA